MRRVLRRYAQTAEPGRELKKDVTRVIESQDMKIRVDEGNELNESRVGIVIDSKKVSNERTIDFFS